MLALPYKGRLHESGYVRFPLNMPASWYDKLEAKLNTEGIVCSIEKIGDKATLITHYRTNVISQIKEVITEAISEDLNQKKTDPQIKEESFLRPVLEETVFYTRRY